MPEISVFSIGLIVASLLVGFCSGWFMQQQILSRKLASKALEQEERAKSQEHELSRLQRQNEDLMLQNSQFQTASKESSKQAKELGNSLKTQATELDALKKQRNQLKTTINELNSQLESRQQELEEQQLQIGSAQEKDEAIAKLNLELSSWQSRVPPLVQRFQERNQQATELEQQLQDVRRQLQELQDSTQNTTIDDIDEAAELDGSQILESILTSHEDSVVIDDIEVGFEAASNEPESGEDDAHFAAPAPTSHEFEVAEDVAADPEEDRQDPAPVSSDKADKKNDFNSNSNADDTSSGKHPKVEKPKTENDEKIDNLQEIKGIGPSIEKTLHELGIYRFQQIAEFSEVEINQVAQHLKGFRTRMYREDWIGQARDLQRASRRRRR